MKSNDFPIRAVGQRTITSTSLFRSSNSSIDTRKAAGTKSGSCKGSSPSLSEFLNRNLHRSSVLPSSVKGKETHFSSTLNNDSLKKKSTEVEVFSKKDAEIRTHLSAEAFSIFKNVEKDKKDLTNHCADNANHIVEEDSLQQTLKRKNLFEVHDHEPSTQKRLAVLGEDLRLPRRRKFARNENMPFFNQSHDQEPSTCKHLAVLGEDSQSSRRRMISRDETRPVFNYYENGGGFWDDNMACVDNEEVGSNDVWEGVGCTTLGGIEWH